MKLTRFGQSCVLIETKDKKILVDPGNLKFEDSFLENEWINIDLILVTHRHGDHICPSIINKIIERDSSKFYTTQEVANTYSEISPEIIKEGDIINLDSIKIEAVKAVHGFVPYLKGDKEINENVGYIIDDGDKRVYLTSDTICFDNSYKCDVIFVPVCNHGLVMSPYEAGLFSKETGAELVIPNHYDNPQHLVDFNEVKRDFEGQGITYKILKLGESIEV